MNELLGALLNLAALAVGAGALCIADGIIRDIRRARARRELERNAREAFRNFDGRLDL